MSPPKITPRQPAPLAAAARVVPEPQTKQQERTKSSGTTPPPLAPQSQNPGPTAGQTATFIPPAERPVRSATASSRASLRNSNSMGSTRSQSATRSAPTRQSHGRALKRSVLLRPQESRPLAAGGRRREKLLLAYQKTELHPARTMATGRSRLLATCFRLQFIYHWCD